MLFSLHQNSSLSLKYKDKPLDFLKPFILSSSTMSIFTSFKLNFIFLLSKLIEFVELFIAFPLLTLQAKK